MNKRRKRKKLRRIRSNVCWPNIESHFYVNTFVLKNLSIKGDKKNQDIFINRVKRYFHLIITWRLKRNRKKSSLSSSYIYTLHHVACKVQKSIKFNLHLTKEETIKEKEKKDIDVNYYSVPSMNHGMPVRKNFIGGNLDQS